MTRPGKLLAGVLAGLCLVGCHRAQVEAPVADHPRLTPNVTLRDLTFYSTSLKRNSTYRVIYPVSMTQGKKNPVIYLLHGGGGSYRDWSNFSDVANYAEQGFILVMPDGGNSYYTNSAEHPLDRYEDFISKDLVADVESHFSVIAERGSRAIVGVSMGGFGAVKIALKHPELFGFVAGLSSALDVPSRPFSIKRISQYRGHVQIFGPWGSVTRHDNDPMVLVRTADPAATPYMFLACGDREGLLAINRRFSNLLKQRGFHFEFLSVPRGNHDWIQWNSQLPAVFSALSQQLHTGQ